MGPPKGCLFRDVFGCAQGHPWHRRPKLKGQKTALRAAGTGRPRSSTSNTSPVILPHSQDRVAVRSAACALRRQLYRPEDKSLMEVLQDNGIDVDFSCEQGVWDTCVTDVLVGGPDYRDLFLTPASKAANNNMCLCVSRAKSPVLVLDV
ncbi:2Fe-2S iron-sulfur cluster-binding protein [Pseudaminobacter sp. NGMCC 1.201702]|uniref:2Fe-2S iron-sulfur cluster-binding protein n=1 Tax=Pseudaminobacter sp. NGMCC 1.201702 TaxID=3391825 RepID=UPI0039EEA472